MDEETQGQKRGRKRNGKRSDPEWKQHSILLRNETHQKALALLREHYPETDFSDQLESLLREWIRRHQPKS
jgi:uncharacterized membrane protein